MSTIIYGVDVDQPVTAAMVRDALVECFSQAHCQDAGLTEETSVSRTYCKDIVMKAFAETGGDFNAPTKDAILHALENLKEFSKKFRDPSIITKHYQEIMQLVSKLS